MTQLKKRVRIHFTKRDLLRWISHRDLARVWERLLRRSGIELAFSEGFHPKPKISFPTALALGIESLDEVVELEVLGGSSEASEKSSGSDSEAERAEIAELGYRIAAQMPAGMELLSVEVAPGKANLLSNSYRVAVPGELRDSVQQRIEQIIADGVIRVARDRKTIECSVDDPHFELRLEGDDLLFTLPVGGKQDAALRAIELLQQVDLDYLVKEGATVQKVKTHLQ